jgi:hypothetical protein
MCCREKYWWEVSDKRNHILVDKDKRGRTLNKIVYIIYIILILYVIYYSEVILE